MNLPPPQGPPAGPERLPVAVDLARVLLGLAAVPFVFLLGVSVWHLAREGPGDLRYPAAIGVSIVGILWFAVPAGWLGRRHALGYWWAVVALACPVLGAVGALGSLLLETTPSWAGWILWIGGGLLVVPLVALLRARRAYFGPTRERP